MTRALLLAAAFLLLPAHDWYDFECCSNQDCAEALKGEPVRGGYRVQVKDGRVFEIEESATRRSHDGRYHVCITPGMDRPRCVYVPSTGT